MTENLQLYDFEPGEKGFENEVLIGLKSNPKSIPPKFFYDSRGSQLFEEITALEEYYLTRCELNIIERERETLSGIIGDNAMLVEFGCGNMSKARHFIDLSRSLTHYVAVDISRKFLYDSAEGLSSEYPRINVVAICADFMENMAVPDIRHSGKTVALFLGSSIGNFEPEKALSFVRNCSANLKKGDLLIIGVDNRKSRAVIERAYNDGAGVTAEFNLNLLRRVNSELSGNFDLENFSHRAFYDEENGRIEMHLVAKRDATYEIGKHRIHFSPGETIHTENSYKYSAEQVSEIAGNCGFNVIRRFQDADRYYSLYVMQRG